MDDIEQYRRKDPNDIEQYRRSVSSPTTPTSEPDWFMPGSKSEAVARGFSQAATLGFGDEIQAAIRAATGMAGDPKKNFLENYRALRDQERGANTAASEENPWSYGGGAVVGSLPQGIAAARGAVLQGPGMLSRMYGAGKVGAGFGAAQGLGQTEDVTNIPQAAKDVATSAGIGGLANAATIPVAAGANWAIKKLPQAVDKTATVLKNAQTSSETVAPAVARGLTQNLSIPTIGALGNMGRVNTFGDTRPDWQSDPYSAMVDTGMAGLQGAVAGYAAQKGTQMAGSGLNIAKDTAMKAYSAARKVTDPLVARVAAENQQTADVVRQGVMSGAQGVENLVNTGKTDSTPFKNLVNFVRQGKGATNPKVQQAAQDAQASVGEGADEAAKRKAAMDLQATAEGRAVSNSENPVRDSSLDDLDEFFRNLNRPK